MALRTEGIVDCDQDLQEADLASIVIRYKQSRHTLEILLASIDDEVERLLLGRELQRYRGVRAPIKVVDIDVCPDVPATQLPPLLAPTSHDYNGQYGDGFSSTVDETIMMSHALGENSTGVTPDSAAGGSPQSKPSQAVVAVGTGTVQETSSDSGLLSGGSVLGDRFEIIKCVGTGGSSAVYKALDRKRLDFDDISPYVAVKVLKSRFSSLPDWLENLKREAQTSQLLVHPNIIRVYDALRDGAIVYIVMEYLSGVPLTHKIRNEQITRLPRELANRIIEAMGRALAFAHRRGIIHCDFKPANVFLTQEGGFKLIDFGIAQLLKPVDPDHPEQVAGLAHPRDLHPVTPAYASPELLDRQDPDPRDDVYSLACTAYELLTGTHPFEFRSALEARKLNLSVERRDGLTRQQWKAFVRGLALTRNERTPTVARFLSELNGWTWQAQVLSRAAGVALVNNSLAWLTGTPRSDSTDSMESAGQTLNPPLPKALPPGTVPEKHDED